MEISEYKPSNTCSRTPGCHQIICYCVIIAENVIFWTSLQSHFQSYTVRMVMVSLYACSVCLLVTLGLITSMLDPSDPVMRDYRSGDTNSTYGNLGQCLYCEHCRSYVLMTSRHCKICDRCIHHFDHHCIWINNCIGRANYKPFVAMIFAAFFNLALFVISAAILWAELNWDFFLSEMVIVWVMSFIAVSFSVMILGLIFLHMYLISKGMTTFQFILAKRDRELKQAQQSSNALQSMNETNEMSQSPPKGGDHEQEGHSEEQHRTENVLQPPPGAYNNQLHLTQEDDRSSDYPSIEPLKQSQNRIPTPTFEKPEDLFKSVEDNFEDFYSHHKSLKLLVGKTILIRSSSNLSDKKQRKRRLPRNFLNDDDKPDQFIIYVNGQPELSKEESSN